MTNPFLPGAGSSNPFLSGSAAPSGHHGSPLGELLHGISKLGGNLGSDALHEATGIPGGLVQLAEHPVGSAEKIGKATWQTWSPLFHGNVGQFAHQTFDHPLAPLLDVATVFTGGAGLLAKAGEKAGELGLIDSGSSLAKLGKADTLKFTRPEHFTDTQPGLPFETRTTSSNPIVRMRQHLIHNTISSVDEHLPSWFTDHVVGNAATYQRITQGKLLARHAAMNAQNADMGAAIQAQVAAMLHAGKVLSSEDARKQVLPQVLGENYWNMRRHAIRIGRNDALPPGYTYVQELTHRNANSIFRYNPKLSVEGHFRAISSRFTARKVENAALENNGKTALIVPKHDMNALGLEGANTASMLMKAWSKPSHLWKMATVGYSPKMVINNALGNWLMYAMRQGGSHSARGVVDAIRYAKSEKAALNAVKNGSTTAAQYLDRGWMQRYFRDEVHPGNSFMGSTLQSQGNLGKASGFKQGLHPLVHKIADQPVRVSAIHAELRGAPEVQALLTKNPKWSFDKAVGKALQNDKTGLRNRVAEHARTIAGDYTRMTPKEQILRQVVPFYAWDKHIAKHAMNLLAEKPGRITGLAAVGDQGNKALAGKFGALPDYMLSELPLGMDKSTGRNVMVDLRGANPYSSFGELAASALGNNSAGFQNIASQANPLAIALAGLLSQSTSDAAAGRQPNATGQGIAGLGASTLKNAFSGIPELTILNEALHGTQDTRTSPSGKTTPLLNEKNLRDTLLTYLAGVPIKRVDMAHAKQIEAKNSRTKKSKNPFVGG